MEAVLLSLAVLACPVGMGVMMWFMAKGTSQNNGADHGRSSASLEDLRTERRRLGVDIARLEGGEVVPDRN